MFSILIANVCIASTIQCVGMTSSGIRVNVISDSDSGTINVNANVLKVVDQTVNGRGVTTEPFINKNGIVVYYSLSTDNYGHPILIQFNGVTQEPELYIPLACHPA